MVTERLPFPLEKLAELVLRARAEGVVLTPLPRSIVMHASRLGSPHTYVVGAYSCSCPAGQHGTPCKHRALWIVRHLDRYAEDIAMQALAGAIVDTKTAS